MFPSENKVWLIVIYEAFSKDIPIISKNVDGIQLIIKESEIRLLVCIVVNNTLNPRFFVFTTMYLMGKDD